jgi:tetratricopeptide (TPR) repeat protein
MLAAVFVVGAASPIAPTAVASPPWQGNFIVTGSVSLPDGNPAARITVRISGQSGLNFETTTDNSGRYQFQVPGGRYRLSAVNPHASEQSTDNIEADTSRTAGNRLVVNLYLRTLTETTGVSRPGVVSAAAALQQIPKEARKAYEDGLKLRSRNQAEKALASFDRAIEICPDYFQALAERGELRITRSEIGQALEDFEHALRLDRDYGPALRGAGYCKLEQQQFTEAVSYLERATSTEPGIADSHLFLGIANLALDRREPARRALLEALKIDARRTVTAHIYLADLYARENEFRNAADELRAYLTARPDAPNSQSLAAKEAELRSRARRP